jgi:hypothetical protein
LEKSALRKSRSATTAESKTIKGRSNALVSARSSSTTKKIRSKSDFGIQPSPQVKNSWPGESEDDWYDEDDDDSGLEDLPGNKNE